MTTFYLYLTPGVLKEIVSSPWTEHSQPFDCCTLTLRIVIVAKMNENAITTPRTNEGDEVKLAENCEHQSFSALPRGLAWISTAVIRWKYVLFLCWRFTSVLLRFHFFTCMTKVSETNRTNWFDCIGIGARHPCPDERAVNHCTAVKSDWWEKWPLVS